MFVRHSEDDLCGQNRESRSKDPSCPNKEVGRLQDSRFFSKAVEKSAYRRRKGLNVEARSRAKR